MTDYAHETAVLQQARQARDKKTVANLTAKLTPPDLEPGLALYVNAYITLDAERADPQGRIPWSSIVSYAGYYNLSRRQTDTLVDYIRVIDEDLLTERAKESARGDTPRPSRNDGHRYHSRKT